MKTLTSPQSGGLPLPTLYDLGADLGAGDLIQVEPILGTNYATGKPANIPGSSINTIVGFEADEIVLQIGGVHPMLDGTEVAVPINSLIVVDF